MVGKWQMTQFCSEFGRSSYRLIGLSDPVSLGLPNQPGASQPLMPEEAVRFTPQPMMKNVDFGIKERPRYEPCGNEEFAVAFQKQLETCLRKSKGVL